MPNYKTIDTMTEQEFRRVVHTYKLAEKVKYLDQEQIEKLPLLYDNKKHLLPYKARIEAAVASVPWFVLDTLQSILNTIISQKMNLGLLGAFCVYSEFLKIVLPPLFALLTPGSALAIGVAILIYVSWTVGLIVILALLNAHAQLQLDMDKLCATIDDLDTDDIRRYPIPNKQGQYEYDVSLGTVGEKIYKTMTYGESCLLLFQEYTNCRIEKDDSCSNRNGFVLIDSQDSRIFKRWDSDGLDISISNIL